MNWALTGSWKMNSGQMGRNAARASSSRSYRSLLVTTSMSATSAPSWILGRETTDIRISSHLNSGDLGLVPSADDAILTVSAAQRPPPLGGRGGWAVAVVGAFAVGAGHGGGAVGVERDGPAPGMHASHVQKLASAVAADRCPSWLTIWIRTAGSSGRYSAGKFMTSKWARWRTANLT